MIHQIKVCFLILAFSSFFSCKNEPSEEIRQNEPLQGLFEYVDSSASGIIFQNEIKDSFLMNILYYEYSYNGSGVAIGDVNNDGLPDIYMNSNMDSGKLFLNQGDLKFRDITLQAGVSGGLGIKTGVCMADVNGDGFLDIYITKSGNSKSPISRKNVLFINNGDLTFKQAEDEYGIGDLSYGTQSYFADIDLDGDLDLFIGNHPVGWGKQDQLNIDIDPNGKYFVVQDTQRQYISDRLYINENGKFVDKTFEYGVDNIAFALSAVFMDVNEDGYPDLYICNDYVAPDILYINQKGRGFQNQILDYFDNISTSSMGSDILDINNDGKFDLFTSDMAAESIQRIRVNNSYVNYDAHILAQALKNHDQFRYNSLQVMQDDNKYSNLNFLTKTTNTDWSWSVMAGDYDNNGFEDFFITNGYLKDVNNMDYAKYLHDSMRKFVPQKDFFEVWKKEVRPLPLKNYFYENNGNLELREVRDIWDGGPKSFSNGCAYGDLDNDGDLDIVVNNINRNAFLMKNTLNDKKATNYLIVSLKQENKNPFALGTNIKLNLNDGTSLYRYFNPIKGYMSSNDYRTHFGFPVEKSISSIEITWPNGEKESFNSIPNNNIVTLVKGTGLAEELISKTEVSKYVKYEVNYNHKENAFIDFKREPFLVMKNSAEGPVIEVGDLNGDGLEDLYIGSASNDKSVIKFQNIKGDFVDSKQPALEGDAIYEDTGAALIDYDKDGDLDIIVSSGGYEFEAGSENYRIRLYDNDGQGNFSKNSTAMPDIRINSYCIKSYDVDNDGDQDLLVGAGPRINFYPEAEKSVFLENDNGVFVDKSNTILPNKGKLGIIKTIESINLEKEKFSIVVTGDWNELKILSMDEGKFEDKTSKYGLSKTNGWWQTLLIDDVDNDGDDDIIAGNLGDNSFFKASLEKPTCIYSNDFDHNGENDPVLCTFYGDTSYPIYSRDELLNQMTTFRKKYLRYRNYENEKLSDMFDAKDIKEATVYNAYIFESSIFYNDNGKFRQTNLPLECQYSMVKGISKLDKIDGQNRYAVVGNFWDTDYDFGKYDASVGSIIRFNNEKIDVERNTGFIASGNVRVIKPLKITEKNCQIIGENNGPSYIYCPLK